MFPVTSRYFGIPTAQRKAPDGTVVVYLSRRFLPPSGRLQLLREHAVAQGERLDLIAAGLLGDPLQWWRIADANDAMRPDDLTSTPGTVLRITLPDGVPGAPNA